MKFSCEGGTRSAMTLMRIEGEDLGFTPSRLLHISIATNYPGFRGLVYL